MTDLLVYPDAERLVIDHLNGLLAPPVSLTVPNPRPEAFLTVQRVGGPRLNLVADNPLLSVEAWGSGPTAAKSLISEARAHLHAMRGQVVGGSAVYAVTEASGPGYLPDPDSSQARYVMTVQVGLRGRPEPEVEP